MLISDIHTNLKFCVTFIVMDEKSNHVNNVRQLCMNFKKLMFCYIKNLVPLAKQEQVPTLFPI